MVLEHENIISKSNSSICAAKNCYSSSLTHPEKSFFRFPKLLARCKIWVENCGRTDLDVSKVAKSSHYKLCEDHFEEKCFTDSSRKLLRRSINPVPTHFPRNISTLLPQGSEVKTIDVLESQNDENTEMSGPVSMCETDIGFSEPSTNGQRLPISYHSEQVLKPKPLDFSNETMTKALLNLNPETQLYKVNEICRFCMNKVPQNCLDLLLDSDEAREIRKVCEVVMPNKFSVCDGLPHCICQKCIADLKTCHRLLEQFRNADNYLRAIAKYSLYLEIEDDSKTGPEGGDVMDRSINEEILKPIPKNAMIVPLKNFTTVLEESDGDLNHNLLSSEQRGVIKVSKGTETDPELDNESIDNFQDSLDMETSSTPNNQLLRALTLPSPQINLITNENMWDGNVAIICENILMTSSNNSNLRKLDGSEDNAHEIHKINQKCFSGLKNNNFASYNSQITVNNKCDNISYEVINGSKTNSATDKEPPLQLKCIFCEDVLFSLDALNKHIIKQHSVNIDCRALEKALKKENSAGQFESLQSQDTKEICWICGVVLNSRDDFIHHLELHDNNQAYNNCETIKEIPNISSEPEFSTCRKEKHFCTKSSSKFLSNTYVTRRSFTCKYCGQKFSQKNILLKHEQKRIHYGICSNKKLKMFKSLA